MDEKKHQTFFILLIERFKEEERRRGREKEIWSSKTVFEGLTIY